MSSTIFFQFQSTAILLLFYWGIVNRKVIKRHVLIMRSAIAWDYALILQIEFTRQAINKATTLEDNTPLLNFHVSIAVSAALLYLFMLWSGQRMLKGDKSRKKLHVAMGILTMILRTSTYITSFLIKA